MRGRDTDVPGLGERKARGARRGGDAKLRDGRVAPDRPLQDRV